MGRITFENRQASPLSILRISHRATGLEHNHFTGFVSTCTLFDIFFGLHKGSKKFQKKKNVFLVCALLERWLILGSFFGGSKLGLGRKLGRNWAAWHLVSVYTCLLLNKETDSRATTEEEKDADNNLVDALTNQTSCWELGENRMLVIGNSFTKLMEAFWAQFT